MIPTQYLKYAKAAFVLILILLLCQQVSRCTASEYRAQIANIERGHAQAEAKQQAHARQWEHKKAEEFAILAEQNIEERNNVIAQRDRIIASLRSGRLSFPACPVPEAAADSGPTENGAEGGQLGLVGEAITDRFAVCDQVTHERNMCVGLMESERKATP